MSSDDDTKRTTVPARENEYGFRVVVDQSAEYEEMMANMKAGDWAIISSFQDFTLPGAPWIYFFARRKKSATPAETG